MSKTRILAVLSRKRLLVELGVVAFFLAVALYILYPVGFHPASLVRGRPFEDAFESIWFLHWYQEALFERQVIPWFQPDIFYPLGWDLRFAILPPLHPILLAPISYFLGAVLTYNLAIITICVFSAYGTYLLSRAFTATIPASVFAGLAYAFYSERQVSLNGHLNFLLASLWVPWMVYGLLKAGQEPERRARWLALAALSFSLSITAAWPFVFMTGMVLLVFGTVYLGPLIWQNWRRWVGPLALAALIVAIVAGPWIVQGYLVRQEIGLSAEFPFANINDSSASIERFFIPNRLNPVLWARFEALFPEFAMADPAIVTFGYVTLPLLLVGAWKRRGERKVQALIVVAAVGIMLILGLTLHVRGNPVTLHWPAAARLFSRIAPELAPDSSSIYLPLPAAVAYYLISPFRSFHGFDRWGMVASLAVGVLAALGFTQLSQNLQKRTRWLFATIVIALLLVELSPLPQTITSTAEMEREVDRWLAAQPEQGVLIEYHLPYTRKGQSLYYTIAHKQKIVHGYSSILPAGYAELLPVLEAWPSAETISLLQEIGVDYVMVQVADEQRFKERQLPRLLEIEPLHLVKRFDDNVGVITANYLFELSPE